MKATRLSKPAGLDQLKMVEVDDPGAPAAGEILVRLHASSLNYHDYAVAMGMIPSADGRIPLSDGAGVVEAVGEGVIEFSVGDHVVSCFFPSGKMASQRHPAFPRPPEMVSMDTLARKLCDQPIGSLLRRTATPMPRLPR